MRDLTPFLRVTPFLGATGSAKRALAQRMRGTDQLETGDELEVRSSWARLIRKVYRVDPLICPRCGGRMHLIALIEEPAVIERILRHLGLWEPLPPMRGPPEPASDEEGWPPNGQIPITYGPPTGYRLSSCDGWGGCGPRRPQVLEIRGG